jgi:hypothetical protein
MRCPVCKATDNRGTQCRRCKADLTLLRRLESARARLLAAALRGAGRGELGACTQHAQEAHRLASDDLSLRTLAVGALLRGDFAAAWWGYSKRRAMLATDVRS